MINGAFGSGKTTIANALVQKIPNSMIFDPEEVGFFLRNVLTSIDPQEGDFQHYPMWRALVVETARLIQEQYQKTLVVPMTIWRTPYFEEVTNGLKQIDPVFYHFCLIAPITIIRERLLARGEEPGSWAERQAEHCVTAFESPAFDSKIDAVTNTPEGILEMILQQLPSGES